MKNHQLIFCLIAAIPSLSFAQGALENPVAGSTESGIGVISGWHCTASNITASIDGASLGKAGNGTGRGDTASICGRADTGYSLLFNYNALPPGGHTISLYADGQLLETRQFNTIQSGGAEFVTGISKTATIADFPSSGKTATLQWSQAKQSFVVTGISGGGSGAVDMSSLQGAYTQSISVSVSGSSCASYGAYSGSTSATFNLTTSGNTARVLGYTSSSACDYNLSYVSGNSTSGFNMNGSVACGSGPTRSVTASNLRKTNNRLYGTIIESVPGCTQAISL
ncbi:MAG: hypothetical protein ACYCY5_01645 [Sulfuricella sp.]